MTELAKISIESVPDLCTGFISVVQLSDVSYVAHVLLQNNITHTSDIDDLACDSSNLTIRINDKCLVKFQFENYIFATNIINECNRICELKLSLIATVKDFYYSGIRAKIGTRRNIILANELAKLLSNRNQPPNFIISHDLFQIDDKYKDPNHTQTTPRQTKLSIDETITINCFYCDASSKNDTEFKRNFLIHPYVSINYSGSAIFICSICVENWNEYRCKAIRENELILAGEMNEELCCLCSDCPTELILCEKCPRSFCHSCLRKVLGAEGFHKRVLDTGSKEWLCMPCRRFQDPPHPTLLSRSNWTKISLSSSLSSSNVGHQRPKLKKTFYQKFHPQQCIPLPRAPSADGTGSMSSSSDATSNYKLTVDEEDLKLVFEKVVPTYKSKRLRIPSSKAYQNKTEIPPTFARTITTNHIELFEQTNDIVRMEKVHVNTKSDDELFYFSQYVKFYDTQACTPSAGKRLCTDDACFLCKDGGELVECDWKKRRHGVRLKCLKVYHEACLAYRIRDDQDWICVRHYCMMCGETHVIRYMCKFCTNSICINCPTKVVEKYGLSKYVVVETPKTKEFEPDVTIIICQTCIDLINRCIVSGNLPENYFDGMNWETFPGQFNPQFAQALYVEKFNNSTSEGVTKPTLQTKVSTTATIAKTTSASVALAHNEKNDLIVDANLYSDETKIENMPRDVSQPGATVRGISESSESKCSTLLTINHTLDVELAEHTGVNAAMTTRANASESIEQEIQRQLPLKKKAYKLLSLSSSRSNGLRRDQIAPVGVEKVEPVPTVSEIDLKNLRDLLGS